MATSLPDLTYPFDPSGTAATNKITNEQQILTGSNFRDFYFIVPKLAPFFGDTVVVNFRTTQGVTTRLVEGVDYYLTHWFIAASRATAKPIYGSISFINTSLVGTLILTYQTLGGVWTLNDSAIATMLANRTRNPRITAWDVITDMPATFPVIDHAWDLQDLVGATELVKSISGIEAALRTTGNTGLPNHIADYNNPHQTNKAQVGLNNLNNWPVANFEESVAGTLFERYMTPQGVLASVSVNAVAPLNSHINNRVNPHGVTATQVGAYTKGESDELLNQKLGKTAAAGDTARFDNKTPTEFRDFVLQGTASNSISFNGKTYTQVITDLLSRQASDSARLEGLTLQGVKDSIATTGVGNAQKFNGYTYAEAKTDILAGSAANTTRAFSLTQPQLTTAILAGTAANATKFSDKTLAELTDYMRIQVGGWENFAVEQSTLPRNEVATTAPYRWINLATIPRPTSVAIAAKLSNAAWTVAGGSPFTPTNAESEHSDSIYLVRCQLTKTFNATTSVFLPSVSITCLSEVDAGLRFGVTGLASGPIKLWVRVAPLHRTLAVTQLTRGIDELDGIDTAATEQDTEPTGIAYGTNTAMARLSDVQQLRADMNSAFDVIRAAMA